MRELYDIPRHFQSVLNSVEVRVFVVLSLSLQISLIFLGSMRKRTASRLVNLALWTAYLSADSVATYALGVLSNSQGDQDCSGVKSNSHRASPSAAAAKSSGGLSKNDQLLAFWAPFLLLHLGGPDTITSFALEDNALWLRHGLTLVFQVLLAIYIFIRSVPFTRLWLPSVFMFLAGILKYGERTVALYYASMDGLKNSLISKPDPGPDYAKLMEEYASKLNANLPAKIIIEPEPENPIPDETQETKTRNETELLQISYEFFATFKRLIVDLILTFHDRSNSQSVFTKLKAQEAFKVIEMELNFVYDMLYTKAPVAHTLQGCILRVFCTLCISTAFVLFFLANKTGYHHGDVIITYVLLYGAMALDLIALAILFSSDWTIVTFKRNKFWRWLQSPISASHESTAATPTDKKCWSLLQNCASTIKKYIKCWSWLRDCISAIRRWTKKCTSLIKNCAVTALKYIKCCNWLHGCTSAIHGRITAILKDCKWCSWLPRHRSPPNPPSPPKYIYFSWLQKSIEGIKRFHRARWCNSMGQYNLITFCLRDKKSPENPVFRFCLTAFKKILEFCHLKDVWDGWSYTSYVPLSEELKGFIFEELKDKVTTAEDSKSYKRFASFRGEWALERRGYRRELGPSVQVEFDKSLLLWHIATDLCYIKEKHTPTKDHEQSHEVITTEDHEHDFESNTSEPNTESKSKVSSFFIGLWSSSISCLRKALGLGLSFCVCRSNPPTQEGNLDRKPEKEMAKQISEYLLYILVCQPFMLSSTAGIGEIRYGDTCAEAMRFFQRGETTIDEDGACQKLLGARTEGAEPIDVKGDRSKSVLWDACILAKKLGELGDKKWKIISEVWVEMLSYASTQCSGNFHARRLSAGGELLTFVWFLMAHLGLGRQYRVEAGHARAKLIVEK